MRVLPSIQVFLLGTLVTAQGTQPQNAQNLGPTQPQPQPQTQPQPQPQPQQQSQPQPKPQVQPQPQPKPPNQVQQPRPAAPNQYQPQPQYQQAQPQPQPAAPNQYQQPRPAAPYQYQPQPQYQQAQPQPRPAAPNQYQQPRPVAPNQWGTPSTPYGPQYSPPVSGPRIGGQIWKPQIGQRIQVILDKRVVRLDPNLPLVPDHADIWDVDLFDTTKETIDVLHRKGKRVMCYLSVGGSESWRPDHNSIPVQDLGDIMPKWKDERYLNLKSSSVWRLMANRIRMAYEKGCDALDPDNVDPFNDDFQRGGGFNLTEEDSVNYLRKVSQEAARYGMSMGMKNAESILPKVSDFIQFAVNEECTTYSTDEDGCWQYEPFLRSGKPVFHFEYVNVDTSRGYPLIQSIYKDWANLSSPDILSYYCFRNTFGFPYLPKSDIGALFSTAIKRLDLGGWVMYCDGTYAETATEEVPGGEGRELDPGQQGSRAGRGGKGGAGGQQLTQPQQAQGGRGSQQPQGGIQLPWQTNQGGRGGREDQDADNGDGSSSGWDFFGGLFG